MSLRNLILTRQKFKRRTTVQITLDIRKCLRSTIWEHANFESDQYKAGYPSLPSLLLKPSRILTFLRCSLAIVCWMFSYKNLTPPENAQHMCRTFHAHNQQRNLLHKKRVQLPRDWFGTPTRRTWRHVKRLYGNAHWANILILHFDAFLMVISPYWSCWKYDTYWKMMFTLSFSLRWKLYLKQIFAIVWSQKIFY